MKRLIVFVLAAVLAMTLGIPAFASETEEAAPIAGSWKLNAVYENQEGGEPVLLEKEENQSLYGAGIGIYTFDEDGMAHYITFDAGDCFDEAGVWTSSEPDVYVYTEEGSDSEMIFTYKNEEGTESLSRSFNDVARDLTFVYNRAVVGSWTLAQVLEIHEGDAPEELPKEENQSLYGSGDSILTFCADGKAINTIHEGGEAIDMEASWQMTGVDQIVYTEEPTELNLQYFRVEDSLLRDFVDEAPDAAHPHLRFIYVRTEPEAAE